MFYSKKTRISLVQKQSSSEVSSSLRNSQRQKPEFVDHGVNSSSLNGQIFDVLKLNPMKPISKSFSKYPCEGSEILARWSDGLYYLGVVQKVDDDKQQSTVQFEDKSVSTVHYKDTQLLNGGKLTGVDDNNSVDVDIESDVICNLCRDGKSEPPNEIVLCDKCGQGYHQLCHAPVIEMSILYREDVPWQCRTCVFAATAKRGGAESEGPAAAALKLMKQALPYDYKLLTWYKGHKVNVEEVYCYCGGPGNWFSKMMQCCRCQQWFHEACIQCLQNPILYGDRFYIFVCSLCNYGNEYLKRLPMRWVDVVHLVLYNLTIVKTVKYYDFFGSLMPFFAQNWELLQLGDLVHEASTRSQLKDRVLETLHNNRTRFQCGSESKKAKMSWGLRTRSPPVPPAITVPTSVVINDRLLSSLDLRHGTHFISDSPSSKKRSYADENSCLKKCRENICDKISLESNYLPHDNVFDRLSTASCRSSIRSESSNSLEEKPKRRGRPRKGEKSLKLEHNRSATLTGVGKRLNSKESSRKSSVCSEASDFLSLSEFFHGPKKRAVHSNTSQLDDKDLRRKVAEYFGAQGRIACGERYKVLAKRVVCEGKDEISARVEYLIEWEGYTPNGLHESMQKC